MSRLHSFSMPPFTPPETTATVTIMNTVCQPADSLKLPARAPKVGPAPPAAMSMTPRETKRKWIAQPATTE